MALALMFVVSSVAAPGGVRSPLGTASGSAGRTAAQASPAETASSSTPAVGSSHAAAAAFNPNCYQVDTDICVSIANPGEADIVPFGANRTSSVMPDCTQSLPLVVKSHDPLNATNDASPKFGPHAPVALNVTGVLWNGDPYYSLYDDSIWHANTNQWWSLQNNGPQNNKTYPWWYDVNISATGPSGQPNFFPGMQVTWWITIVYSLPNSQYVTHEGPHLTYTCAGAWPYSPYPGAPHYGGPSAIFLDTNVSLSPRQPNWNDSVHVTINTTQVDVAPYNATIGAATIDVLEVAHGLVIANTSWSFNVTIDSISGFGNTTTTTDIPPSYAQIQGATISYRIWITDTSKVQDWLVSPWTNYTVNGNGSFATGSFTSDLTLSTDPTSVILDAYGYANLTPGQPLQLVVTSNNPTDALLAVEVQYTVSFPLLHESIPETALFHRVSSVHFKGTIPALPMESIVNFSVFAWDFGDSFEQSAEYSYSVESLAQYNNGEVNSGLAFFYVFVYDNGTSSWVPNATVQIQGPSGILNSVSHTTLGVAYANQSGAPFLPHFVEANTTYNVTVTDPGFAPPSPGIAGPITVHVQATNPMTVDQPLATGSDYVVLQEGDEIFFFLNTTGPAPLASPTVATGAPLGDLGVAGAIGIIGALAVAGPVLLWWVQIKRRRTAEEKRVTL